MAAKLDRIQDQALRESMEQAKAALRSGDYTDVVRRCAEAYVDLLRRKPELLKGPIALRSVLFFPRLGVHLIQDSQGAPELVWDRDRFIFSEAVTYYEYAVDSLIKNGL